MHDVEVRPVPQEEPPDREPEPRGRPERTPTVGVHRAGRHEPDHIDAGERGRPVVPVPHRQVRDVVAGSGEREREIVHPPLAAADGRRVEMVVDEADPHAPRQPRTVVDARSAPGGVDDRRA